MFPLPNKHLVVVVVHSPTAPVRNTLDPNEVEAHDLGMESHGNHDNRHLCLATGRTTFIAM